MQDSLTSSFRWGETFDTAPLCQRLQHRSFNDNGRTDRASLQRVTRLIVTRLALTQWTHDHEFIQILVLQRLMAELVVLM